MKTCAKPPAILNAKISPSDATIDYNANYTITCNAGYTQSGGFMRRCTDSGQLEDKNISCTGKL